jgi:hypothetical protein
VQKFTVDVNPQTGAISNFNLLDTILFTQNGSAGNLGVSLDPEGFAVVPNGNFYVADEY